MLTVRRRGTTALPAAYQPEFPKDSCGPGYEFIELSALAPVHVGSLRDSAAACAPAKTLELAFSCTADVSSSRTGMFDGHSGLVYAV